MVHTMVVATGLLRPCQGVPATGTSHPTNSACG